MAEQSSAEDYRGSLGRYALFGEIAAGGMATVHLGRLMGSVGFARTVAIKRLHPHLAKDPDFVGMFLEEARLAARVRHPNVITTLDVVCEDNELFLVMEYVAGETLSRLVRKTREAGQRVPLRYVLTMMCAALDGLQAAHDATSERGAPLGIVHRDVSPQNIHVGIDGVARVLDFGIAKATNRVQETRTDQIKGKVAYMSPEQLAKGPIDRRADVYSACVVLWEALTGARLFKADDVPSLVFSIINDDVLPPSSLVPDLPPHLDRIVMKGLDRNARNRWSSARELAEQLEKILPLAPPREIGEWVKATAGDALEWRIELVHRIESETSTSIPPPLRPSPLPQKKEGYLNNRRHAKNENEVSSGVVHSPPPDTQSDATTHELDDGDEDPAAREGNDDAGLAAHPTGPPESVRAIDVGANYTETRGKKTRIVLIAFAVGLLLAGASVLAFRLIQLQKRDDASNVGNASPSTESSNESAIGLGISRTASAAPAASSSAPQAPSAIATKPKSDTPITPATSVRPTPPPPPPPVSNECDNPFTVDAKGVRHPKPHCFKR